VKTVQTHTFPNRYERESALAENSSQEGLPLAKAKGCWLKEFEPPTHLRKNENAFTDGTFSI
jgi:hypothetical protein